MTVSSTTTKVSYTGNGSTTVFAYTFKVFTDTEVSVYVDNVLKTLTTHYTVSGVGGASGGNITFTVGNTPAASLKVVLIRNLARTQLTDYVENDTFPAETHEAALDKLTFILQEIDNSLNSDLFRFAESVSDAGTVTIMLNAATRASKILSFDASGDLQATQEIGTFTGNWAASTAYSLRDLIKDTSNNNIYICTTVHTSTGVQPISGNADVAKWALIVDAASATASAAAAAADLILTNADVVLTHADVLLTNADVVLTNADVVLTNADVVSTNADVVTTTQDAIDTAADVVTTTQDAIDTAADLVATNQDTIDTAADLVATNQDTIDTAADVVSTAADVVTTGEIAGAVALPYIFNTTTTMADPAGTFFRLNSATPASVTAIAFGDTTADAVDLSAWVADWADSSSAMTGTIRIVQQGTPANTMVFNVTAVTDNTDWLQVTVQHVAGAVLFTLAATCRVTFTRTGDKGSTGISPGLPFRFNSATTDSDKDAGDFWYDAVVGSATILYVDDADTDGNAVSSITDLWDDNGSATHRGILFIKQDAAPSNMAVFKVTGTTTDAVGYSKINVTLIDSFGTISDNDLCHVEFAATGTGGIANRTVDTMTGDASDTTLLLSQAPGSENNVTVTFDGVTQHHDTYSLSGSTITFSTAPPLGVAVEAVSGGLESIGTPSDGTVTNAKLDSAQAAVIAANTAKVTNATHTGDVTGSTALTIAANAVDETKLKDALVADFTEVVVSASDSILLGDATDSGNTKRDTVQGILDLVPSAAAGWTSMGAVTTTSGATSLISGIPAGVVSLMVCLDGVSQTGAVTQVQMTLGDAGGLETSGYICTNHQTPGASGTSSTTNMLILQPGGAPDLFTGIGFLTRVDTSTNDWVWAGHYKQSTGHQNISAGEKSLSGELTQIQIAMSSGTFDLGQWNIWYQ